MSVVLVITKQIAIRMGTFISVDHKIRNYICFEAFLGAVSLEFELSVSGSGGSFQPLLY